MVAKMLVVEDNPTNLELMIYLLAAHGYQPLTAMDGLEGVDAAQRERPDLIVCDVQLPKADGFEVVKRLKAQKEFRKVPVIAVTALAMVGDRERLLSAGFDGYIAKPIEPETFVKQVEGFLPSDLRAGRRTEEIWEEPPPERRAQGPLSGTILVVDDTDANRELVRSILEPHGYAVVAVATVAKAKAELQRSRPDLILADVHLQDGTSLDLIRDLRADAQFQSLPILIQSASAEELEREGIRGLGITLLNRPLEPEQLLHEIASALSPNPAARM